MSSLVFSTFEVTRQAFYRNTLAYAIVNLKPIVPGRKHVARLWRQYTMMQSNFSVAQMSSLYLHVPCSDSPS